MADAKPIKFLCTEQVRRLGMSGFPLPTELILLVFRWIVPFSRALSPSFNSFFSSEQYDFIRIKESDQARGARRMNVILLRVCREWLPLARELLFEYL